MMQDHNNRGSHESLMEDERGIAFLTVMMIMLIMTVIGIGSMTITGLEHRVAGVQMAGETSVNAAESCLGTSVNVIQQAIATGSVPSALVQTGSSPTTDRPIRKDAETSAAPTLTQEIFGQFDNHSDAVTGTGTSDGPDYWAQVNNYDVRGDIDRLYVKPKSGSGLQFAAAYEGIGGGAGAGGVDVLYRVDCQATLTATGTSSHVMAVYACELTGETCQRKL